MLSYPVAVNDVQTRVLETGEGPPVVFIHGLGARADRWRFNLPPIAQAGYRCVAIDLPGHGFASKSREFPFGVPACSRWLWGVLDQLAIRTAVLVGTSLGGFIAAEMACRQPERVGGIMLVGTIGMVPMGLENREAISARFGTVTREGIERKLRAVLYDQNLVSKAWIEEEWRINNSLGAHDAFAEIADYIRHRIDDDVVGPELAVRIRQGLPVGMVWGREDRAVQLDVGHRSREVLQPSSYEEIPGTGHGPYLEKPEVFNRLLGDFLQRCEVLREGWKCP